jgi:hypothetical protein
MHFGARFYHPYLNRMIQPDTIVPEPGNPQALNRYAFVYNNPLRYTDPSGHAPQACYGTSAFISESTGDGGISEASCWARQRDNRILERGGMSSDAANVISATADTGGIGIEDVLQAIVGAYPNVSIDVGCGSPCFGGYPIFDGMLQNWDRGDLVMVKLALDKIVTAFGGATAFGNVTGQFVIGRAQSVLLQEINRQLVYGSTNHTTRNPPLVTLFDPAFSGSLMNLIGTLAHEIGHVIDHNSLGDNGSARLFGDPFHWEDVGDAMAVWTLDKAGYAFEDYKGQIFYNPNLTQEQANDWIQKVDALMTDLNP